jgi:glycosyltransferase involved in cell wall biosynthesis
MKISYAIPVCNEYEELKRLVDHLLYYMDKNDEIIILADKGNTTKEVKNYLKSLDNPIKIYYHSLNKNFSTHKNYLNSKCTGDWIFQIDADEYPDAYLVQSIHYILEQNPDLEACWISRINTVLGITQEHIQQWRWRLDEFDRINFPDRQLRLYKNIPERIKWKNKVHEQLIGYKSITQLPDNEEYCLHHPKDIKRQEKQNQFYNTI